MNLISPDGHGSPGPTRYDKLPSIGSFKPNPEGRQANPPVWQFAKADRFAYGYGRSELRPEAHDIGGGIGRKESNGTKPDAPNFSIGKSTREDARKVHTHSRTATAVSNARLAAAVGSLLLYSRAPSTLVRSALDALSITSTLVHFMRSR